MQPAAAESAAAETSSAAVALPLCSAEAACASTVAKTQRDTSSADSRGETKSSSSTYFS